MILTQLKQDIDVLAVLEKVLEVANVRVLDTSVDLDLTHEFLLGSTLCQTALLDDFGRMHECSLRIDKLEALGKASFAEEFSFQVPSDADFTIRLFELFFNHGLLRLVRGTRGLGRLSW